MDRRLTCIICPNGCEIRAQSGADGIVTSGEGCPRGREYAVGELTAPVRTLSTSVRVTGGDQPLCSARLTKPIPKALLMEAADAIHALRLRAPVEAGTVLLTHILGTDSDVIATRSVAAKGTIRPDAD